MENKQPAQTMKLTLHDSLAARSLRAVLAIVFALIFTIPLLLFFAIVVHYDLLGETLIQLTFAAYLFFALVGYMILRNIIDRIVDLSVTATSIHGAETSGIEGEHNELNAITNSFASLLDRLEKTTDELGRRIRELTSLSELAEICTVMTDNRLLFGKTLEKTMEITRAQSGIVLLLSEDGDSLTPSAVRGAFETAVPDAVAFRPSSVTGKIFNSRHPLLFDDPAEDALYNGKIDGLFAGEPLLGMAIRARGRIIGALMLSGRHNGSFMQDESDYLVAALGQMGFAFDNMQLIREMEEAYRTLETTQEKMVELERAAAISQTVVTLSDKINSPLTVIQGHAELLGTLIGDDDGKINRSLTTIEESVAACSDLMRQLSGIQSYRVVDYAGGRSQMIDVKTSRRDREDDEDGSP